MPCSEGQNGLSTHSNAGAICVPARIRNVHTKEETKKIAVFRMTVPASHSPSPQARSDF